MNSYTRHATFYRVSLLLGLVPGETVVAWADHVLGTDGAAPPAFIDLASTPPDQLSAMRHVLQRLADGTESPSIVRAILDVVRRDLASDRRSPADTMRVFTQMRRGLALPVAIESALDTFVDDYMLAVAGVIGEAEPIEARLRAWLARFEGEYEMLMEGGIQP